MWIKILAACIFVVFLRTTSGYQDFEPFHNRNQRIIKLHSSPFKQHPHYKYVRPGPLGSHLHYHDNHDLHYTYIRPNQPPPIPPFSSGSYGSSPSSKYVPRPIPHHLYKPSTSYGVPFKTPSSSNFRSPIVKDHFRPPSFASLPSKPSFDYIASSKPTLNHIINSDDDRGPIHEIPAPDLAPKPHLGDPSSLYTASLQEPDYNHIVKEPEYNHVVKEPDYKNIIKEPPAPFNFEKKPGYEVVESNDKVIHGSDGTKGYYAPDPDPSLPQPKIPPTTDPYSTPSNPKPVESSFPTGQEYQLQEVNPHNTPAPIPNLSSQELYDLMHSFPNDQYTVIQSQVLPQPMLATLGPQPQFQHFGLPLPNLIQQQPNSHQEVESNGLIHSSAVHHQYQDFNHPHYQSFNYDELSQNSGAVPVYHRNQYGYDPDVSETEIKDAIAVVRQTAEKSDGGRKKTESVKKTLPSELLNLIPDDDYEKEQKDDQSPIFKSNTQPEVPFYSSLPNKEAAEALATLQAAGSIATKLKSMRGDQPPEEDSPEEQANFGIPKAALSKPQQVVKNQAEPEGQTLVDEDYEEVEEEEEVEPEKTEEKPVEVQKSVPVYEAVISGKSLTGNIETVNDEVISSLNIGQGAVSNKYGRRIRPK